jgi:hypothetical protein
MSISHTLYGARDYMREHGWTRGALQGKSGRVCILGALAAAERGNPNGWASRPVYDAVSRVTGGSIALFNDGDCLNADDAISALEIAADIAFSEGL